MSVLVLDSEPLSELARGGRRETTVRAALRAAIREESEVVVPAAVLAELYRGGGHDQTIDACLGREGGIGVIDTDRSLARRIGNLLARSGLGSAHHVDGSIVAVCASRGGGVVLTSDTDDIARLASQIVGITVEPL